MAINLGKIDFKSKEVQNKLGAVGIGAIAIFAFFKWVYGPMGPRIKELETQIEDKEKLYAATVEKANKLPQLEAEYEALKAVLSDMEKKLPKEIGKPQLLNLVTDIGRKYSIDITNFNPKRETKDKYYTVYPTDMNIKTSYHRLGYFLTEMGQQERVLTFKDLSITAQIDEKKKVNLITQLTLCAYTYNEQ